MLPVPILTIGVAVLGAVLLAYSIVRLVAVVRDSVIVRLPAAPEQDVDFKEGGTVALCMEQSRLDSSLWGVNYAMRDSGGRDVPSAPILFRTKVSSFSRVRLSVRSFEIPRPGRYRLIVSGIAPGRDTSQSAIVFTRPFAARMVLWILGIVFAGFCLIGGIVLYALGAAGKL